jgi:surfactin synthase thioesterase subunit
MDDALVRRVNLIECLAEDHEDVPPPPDDAPRLWSEPEIRRYFASRGADAPTRRRGDPTAKKVTPPPAAAAAAAAARPIDPPDPPVDDATFRAWFPGLRRSGTEVTDGRPPRLRVLCFANAGNAEDAFTSEGTGARRSPSPLLEWCRANRAEVLAVQLPGRGARVREPLLECAREVARALLPVVRHRLFLADDAPWAVVGHSVGSWLAFEFLRLARRERFAKAAPVRAFYSAFPAPDIAMDRRPWRPNAGLADAAFRDEARAWGVSEIVFEKLWGTYEKILRADFSLFDRYRLEALDDDDDDDDDVSANDANRGHPPGGHPPGEEDGGGTAPVKDGTPTASAEATAFDHPATVFHGSRDARVTEAMTLEWARFHRGAAGGEKDRQCVFESVEIEGGHLFNLEKDAKRAWLERVVEDIERELAP